VPWFAPRVAPRSIHRFRWHRSACRRTALNPGARLPAFPEPRQARRYGRRHANGVGHAESARRRAHVAARISVGGERPESDTAWILAPSQPSAGARQRFRSAELPQPPAVVSAFHDATGAVGVCDVLLDRAYQAHYVVPPHRLSASA
jgi:hypothetical protein